MGDDKIYHLIAGAGISCTALIWFPATMAIGFAAAAGVAKEIFDFYNDGTVEAADVLATVIGGCIPIIIMGVM